MNNFHWNLPFLEWPINGDDNLTHRFACRGEHRCEKLENGCQPNSQDRGSPLDLRKLNDFAVGAVGQLAKRDHVEVDGKRLNTGVAHRKDADAGM